MAWSDVSSDLWTTRITISWVRGWPCPLLTWKVEVHTRGPGSMDLTAQPISRAQTGLTRQVAIEAETAAIRLNNA